jgi:hypothetical protein
MSKILLELYKVTKKLMYTKYSYNSPDYLMSLNDINYNAFIYNIMPVFL